MKFWQLVSIARDDANLIARVASTRPAWESFRLLSIRFSELVIAQDRVALDSVVDTEFAVAVLAEIRQPLYLSSDNWLRSWRLHSDDQELRAVEAFNRYGADVVEATFEKGALKVDC